MIDPDTSAGREAAAVIKEFLSERKMVISKNDASVLATAIVCKWLSARVYHWSMQRQNVPPFPSPDPEIIGYAKAALGLIADQLPDAPWDKAICEWSGDQAAQLFATAWEAIEARRMHTLEDPNGVLGT